jgi:hypothetical protein
MEEIKRIREQYCNEKKLETCYPPDSEFQASWVCLPTWEYVEWLEEKLDGVATTSNVLSLSRQVETLVSPCAICGKDTDEKYMLNDDSPDPEERKIIFMHSECWKKSASTSG